MQITLVLFFYMGVVLTPSNRSSSWVFMILIRNMPLKLLPYLPGASDFYET